MKDLAGRRGEGAKVFGQELAWREFYADVLWHRPETAREYLKPEFAGMAYDEPDERFDAWCAGQTGYPFVDAGMRQLLATGWIHNRVRMVVASFLVKDLHVEWQHGARHFLRHLCDGDLASNNHGWQWVAGCGTDAAPYFRIFNPVSQGQKFDPRGDYVRRYVTELRHLDDAGVHEPWVAPDGYQSGYPERIVDHKAERSESLVRLEAMRVCRLNPSAGRLEFRQVLRAQVLDRVLLRRCGEVIREVLERHRLVDVLLGLAGVEHLADGPAAGDEAGCSCCHRRRSWP